MISQVLNFKKLHGAGKKIEKILNIVLSSGNCEILFHFLKSQKKVENRDKVLDVNNQQ